MVCLGGCVLIQLSSVEMTTGEAFKAIQSTGVIGDAARQPLRIACRRDKKSSRCGQCFQVINARVARQLKPELLTIEAATLTA